MPKTAKKKQTQPKVASWAEAEAALTRIKTLESEISVVQAALDQSIAKAQADYNPRLEPRKGDLQALGEALCDFVADHQDELDEGLRSRRLQSGTVGIRSGPPKLEPMARTTWDKVIELAVELPDDIRDVFVKMKPTLDRRLLLRAIQKGALSDLLRKQLKVKVVQEDTVYYEVS